MSSTMEKEKKRVTLISVVAAVFLTGFKLVIGLLTGSLGLLSEALHSALDLVAAIITYFAVRISDKPADSQHQYGHGKVENLSAFIETLLLFNFQPALLLQPADQSKNNNLIKILTINNLNLKV